MLKKPTDHTQYFLQRTPLNCLRFPKPLGKLRQPVKHLFVKINGLMVVEGNFCINKYKAPQAVYYRTVFNLHNFHNTEQSIDSTK